MIERYMKFLFRNNYSVNTIRSYKNILLNNKMNIQDIRSVKKYIFATSKRTTMHTRYNVIYSYYKWSKDRRLLLLKNIKIPPIENIYRPVVTKKEIYLKTSKLAKKDLLIRFLFETGIRASEIYTIHDVNEKTIKVTGKGNKVREIFHSIKTTNCLGNICVTTKTIRKWVKEVLGNEFTPHSIRRSHATHMLLNGANIKTVSKQLGHAKVETTYLYLQLSKEQNFKIYNKYF